MRWGVGLQATLGMHPWAQGTGEGPELSGRESAMGVCCKVLHGLVCSGALCRERRQKAVPG